MIHLTTGDHAGQHAARVRDLSKAGICFYMEYPIPLMTVLEIALELPVEGHPPGSKPGPKNGEIRRVRGTGAVVRCEPISASIEHYEVAVFIQHMEETDREAVAAHVAKLAG